MQGRQGRQYNRPMLRERRIAFVGAGNMAEALIAGLLRGQHTLPAGLMAADIDSARRQTIHQTYGTPVTERNREAAEWAEILVLAVEPQVLDEVLQEIAPAVAPATLVVSVAAGYPLSRVARHLAAGRKIVRAMPNTPSIIRQGVTALAYGQDLSEEDTGLARALFESIGKVVLVEERLMDAVTGLSGSGPAYVFVMIEALADGGVLMGLPRQAAQLLAAQTVAGAAQQVLLSREHPGVLKDRVASPGGTTIAGLQALEQGRFRATLAAAVEAATRRSAELGRAN